MDRHGLTYRESLRSQIEEAYGRLTYTYTTQNKQADIDSRRSGVVRWLLLALSVVSTGSVMSLFFADTRAQLWVAVICSAVLALLSAYSKSADLDGKAAAHKRASDSLWPLREEYKFNKIEGSSRTCSAGDTIWTGECSYIEAVRWSDFKRNVNTYIDRAYSRRDRIDEFDLTKSFT